MENTTGWLVYVPCLGGGGHVLHSSQQGVMFCKLCSPNQVMGGCHTQFFCIYILLAFTHVKKKFAHAPTAKDKSRCVGWHTSHSSSMPCGQEFPLVLTHRGNTNLRENHVAWGNTIAVPAVEFLRALDSQSGVCGNILW